MGAHRLWLSLHIVLKDTALMTDLQRLGWKILHIHTRVCVCVCVHARVFVNLQESVKCGPS